MKKSSKVMVGNVLFAGMLFAMSGCATEPDQQFMESDADYQEICLDREDNERVEFEKCDQDSSNGHTTFFPYYLSRAYGSVPAVGSKINPAHGTSIRPASGTIARPPASGGFGTSRVTSGGS